MDLCERRAKSGVTHDTTREQRHETRDLLARHPRDSIQ